MGMTEEFKKGLATGLAIGGVTIIKGTNGTLIQRGILPKMVFDCHMVQVMVEKGTYIPKEGQDGA